MLAISSSSETPETFWRRSWAASTAAWAIDCAFAAPEASAPIWRTSPPYWLVAVLVSRRAATAVARALDATPGPEPAGVVGGGGVPGAGGAAGGAGGKGGAAGGVGAAGRGLGAAAGGGDAGAERSGGVAGEEGRAVGGVDVVVQRLGAGVERGQVAGKRGGGERLERAELAAAGGEARGRRRLPVGGPVVDHRLVAEHDLDAAVAELADRHLAILAEVIEDLVAAVEQVVGALPGVDGRVDRLVELHEAGGGRLDRARGAGDAGELGVGVVGGAREVAGELAERVAQRLGGRGDGLLGAVGLGVVREVAPRGVELPHQRVDAGGRRLADGALHAVERLGARGRVAQGHALRADLEIEEGVAQATVGGHVDALAEERARAVLGRAGRQVQRAGRAERGLLARVADGVGVGDVVRGDVEGLLLGQEALQRGLQSEEARDHD